MLRMFLFLSFSSAFNMTKSVLLTNVIKLSLICKIALPTKLTRIIINMNSSNQKNDYYINEMDKKNSISLGFEVQ